MKDILFSLYLEYCRLQDKYQELMRDYNDMWDRKNRLQRRCEALEKSVEELEVMEKDYGRIREFFGVDKVDFEWRKAQKHGTILFIVLI